jgi:hypothetical protein
MNKSSMGKKLVNSRIQNKLSWKYFDKKNE